MGDRRPTNYRLPRLLFVAPLLALLAGITACASTAGTVSDFSGAVDAISVVAPADASTAAAAVTQPPALTPTVTAAVTATPGGSASSSTAPPAPGFVSLNLTFDRICAPQAGVTSVQAILRWQVAGASGIEVNINNPNQYGATQYLMISGAVNLTSVSCVGSSFTFDVWTVGNLNGPVAHRRLTYTPDNN